MKLQIQHSLPSSWLNHSNCLRRNIGFSFYIFICSFSNCRCSCTLQNDMYLLQLTKRIYCPKTNNQNNLFSGKRHHDLPGRCRKFPTWKSGLERLVDLETSCTACNVLAQYMRDPPKGLVTASSNKSNSGEQARWWKNTEEITTFSQLYVYDLEL